MNKLLISAMILSMAFSVCFCDSLWDNTSSSPFSPTKAFRVGDIIDIIILESTSAVQKAGTDTNKSDNLGATFDHTIASLNIQPSNSIKGTASGTFGGLGSTSRQSNVTAKVAAIVVRVLANGNLVVTGQHKLEVNGETETVTISGIVRAKDVSLANTVFSYQVAAAEVSVKGRGVVGDAGSPGWFSKVFNWIF